MAAELSVAVSLFANDRGRSGIGRYLQNVVGRLPAADPELRLLLYVAREDLPVFSGLFAADDPRARFVAVDDRWNAPPASLLWHAVRFPALARQAGARVLYLPAGNRRLAPFSPLPTVAVVHDLSWLHMRGKYDFARQLYLRGLLPWMIRRATRVVAISGSTEQDLVALAACDPRRLVRIGNGYDAQVFQPREAAASRAALAAAGGRSLPARFLLYVSRLEHPGKNHVGLLRAYRRLLDRHPDLAEDLVLAGGRWNGAEAVEREIVALGLGERVHLLGYVADEQLPLLYATARALVFPSLFEGFGLPILEAQACGLPVAGSAVSSIPEVIGEAGLLFDPHDPVAIADAVERLLFDDELRGDLARRGLENAHRHTWEVTAAATARLLREVAGGA